MKITKKTLTWMLSAACAVTACVSTLCIVLEPKPSLAQEALTISEQVNCEKNYKVSDSFLGGKTGYKLSTAKNREGFKVANGVAGAFSAEFVPLSDDNVTSDYTEIAFEFTSPNSREGFSLHFMEENGGTIMRLNLTNSTMRHKDYAISTSFATLPKEAIRFTFDEENMLVLDAEGREIIDLHSDAVLSDFRVGTRLDFGGFYDVEVKFNGIKEGRKAKMALFELCGQNLSGKTLVDTSAPVVYQTPSLDKGVKGTQYTIPTNLSTYDLFDGASNTFSGDIQVKDSKNNSVSVSNGKFTPNSAGNYYIEYTPKDKAGNEGETTTLTLSVLEATTSVEFCYAHADPVPNERVGTGTVVFFPSVYGASVLTTKKIDVSAKVELGGKTLFTKENCADGFTYQFEESGEYTIKFVAEDVDGESYMQSYTVEASSSLPAFETNLNAVYAEDAIVQLGFAKCVMGGSPVSYRVETTYPGGQIKDAAAITLDETGLYTTKYIVDDYTFIAQYRAENDNATLWETNDALTVEANVDAPDYADYAYNGTMLTATRFTEAVYKNTIDLSDNTKEDVMLEFFVAPTTAGTIETSEVDIILTDVHNASNVVDVKFRVGPWYPTQNEHLLTSVMALPTRDYTMQYLDEIYKGENYERTYFYTTRIASSMYGKISNSKDGDNPSQSIKLFFDYNDAKIYVSTGYNVAQVADLRDEEYVGNGNAFKGFTTGEAKLSVKIAGVTQTAHVMILNIDGQSTSGKYADDSTSPSIFVDYAGNKEDKLPNGVVGVPYTIFSAHATDVVDGKKENVNVSVYKVGGEGLEKIEFIGDTFTPNSVGEYLLRYETMDLAGLKTVKDVTVTVVNECEPLQYVFNAQNAAQANIGEDYRIYKGSVSGGTGIVSETIKVTLDGQPVEVDADGVFAVTKKGSYVIEVVLKDYVQKSAPFTMTVEAGYADKPIIDLKTMPKLLIAGETVQLPKFTAVTYSEGHPDGENIPVNYFVDGEEIENGLFTPTAAGKVTIEVKVGSTTLDYDVFVNEKVVKGKEYPTQFLYVGENVQTSVVTRGTQLDFSEDTSVYVARKLHVQFLDFKLAGVRDKSNLSKIDLVLTDSLNPNLSVTIHLEKKTDDNSVYIVYDGRKYLVNASFDNTNMDIVFGFTADGYITFRDNKIVKVDKTDSGITFNGFTSDSVYLEIQFKEVTKASSFIIESIGGQEFDASKSSDRRGPAIKLNGSIGEIEMGDTVYIPSAVAYDFASGADGVKLIVYSPSDEVLVGTTDEKGRIVGVDASEAHSIVANEIGEYIFEYESVDALGNSETYSLEVEVIDRIPPQITLSGKVPTTGRVGTAITLPTMSVKDDNFSQKDILAYVYYIAPSGQVVRVTDNQFTPTEKGQYIVAYFAQDGSNATTVERYVVEVR